MKTLKDLKTGDILYKNDYDTIREVILSGIKEEEHFIRFYTDDDNFSARKKTIDSCTSFFEYYTSREEAVENLIKHCEKMISLWESTIGKYRKIIEKYENRE